MNVIYNLFDTQLNHNTKAVIFDCFGTLMQIKDKHMPYKYLKEELYKNNIVIEDFAKIVMDRKCEIEDIEKLAQFKFNNEQKIRFKQMLEKELRSVQIYEDVNQYLKELKIKNIKTILCSNLAYPYGRSATSMTLPLDKYVLSYEVGYIKPQSEIFQLCLNQYNLNKDEVVYVGDSVKDDYNGATEFGIKPFLIKRK